MTYIVKRKFRGILGDDVDNAEIASLLQHIQSTAPTLPLTFDSLTLNNLVVRRTNKIPFGTDKYKIGLSVFENYVINDDSENAMFGVNWGAQLFTPSTAHTITKVRLLLRRQGASGTPGTITVSIRNTTNNRPSGGDLASGFSDGNTLTTNGAGEWREITFGGGTDLVANTRYAIIVRVTSGDTNNSLRWRDDSSSPTYAGGQWENSTDSGSNWNIVSGNDMMFEEWGVSPEKSTIWNEGSNFRSIDENSIERKYIHTDDVDDTPVDGATTDPISSNWAFDHENDEDVHDAVQVNVSELSTATYDDVQDYINFFGDRTLLTGGGITDNGDGTVAIASLTAWCAISDSETAVGKFFDFAGGNTSSLTDMTTNYIYLDYNGGTPQLVLATSILTHGFKLDHIHIGTAFRDGTETHFHKPTNFELDLGAKVDMHHQEETLVHRVDGLITTATGTRNLDVTAGVLYEGLNRHTSLPFDTSRSGTADLDETNKLHDQDADFSVNDVGKHVHNTTDDTYGTITAFVNSGELTLAGDTFPDGNEAYNIDFWTYHYYDGDLGTPAWVEVHGATQISNSQYNDVDTGLVNFTANRYGVSWVFMEIDGQHFHVVYGQGDYKVNQAEEAGVPSSLPNIVTNYCALIAKIILQQGQTTMTITYPWTTVFTSSFATDHGSLGGLGDVADHDYALLHNGTRALSGAWDMGSQNLTNVNIDSGTLDGTTITAPVLDGTVTNTGAALVLPAHQLGGALDANSNDITGVGTLKTARLTLTSDQIEEHVTNGNAGTIALNFNGYLGGTTRFRDVDIYNGKQTRYGLFDGSASRFTVDNFGATTLQGTLNANSNAITNHPQAIADNAILTVDGSPNDDEFARFTAAGLEGLTGAETMAALSGTATAEFLLNTQKIGGIVDPTTDQQAATKKYVDDNAGGASTGEMSLILSNL